MLSQEHRPVKRPSLGPPDLYAQKVDQREDYLTNSVLKQGFINELVCTEEHGTARKEASCGLNQSQVLAYLNGILQKKTDFNTLADAGKKRPPVQKENFFLVTPNSKHKQYVEVWMNCLANGTKTLTQLAKRVPIFHKKEEFLQNLFDYSVPNPSAAWYMKMTAAFNQTQNENKKTPRRHLNDPSQEWTQVMTKYMSELQQKMVEYYGGGQSSVVPGFLTTGSQVDIDSVNKRWHYCDKLALHMYQEGLLDRHEYLSWAIDLLENTKVAEENILRVMMSLVYQYIKEIVKQYLLSRKLAQFCSKKLIQMMSSSGYVSPRSTSPHLDTSTNSPQANTPAQMTALSTLNDIWSDYLQCNQHRSILYMVCSMLQTVVLACPSALVWLNMGEGKSTFIQSGSPLDLLPCHPCLLPIAPGDNIAEMRRTMRESEIEIARRSMAAELSWSSDKVQQSMTGFITGKLLSILDKLDRYNFDKADTSPAIDQIYNTIMSIWNEKTNNEPYTSLEPLVFLLCDWAITRNRLGDHRPLIVAKLLEKQQMELWNSEDDEGEMNDSNMEKEEDNVFHNILLKYLDKRAPVLDEGEDGPSESNRSQFANCVALFAELIRLDLFSHDVYVCTLISRGDLNQTSTTPSNPPPTQQQQPDRPSKSVLKEILESEDEGHAATPMSSVASTSGASQLVPTSAVTSMPSRAGNPQPPRHLQYVTHFPIPQEEQFLHECNQRSVVLFGVGKGRENSKHHARRVSKDLQKLFSKKCSIDVLNVADNGKAKLRADTELDNLLGRFQSLAYYDQYCIGSSTMEHILEMLDSFVSKSSTHVPLVEYIMFFLDLVESSLNITALISFCEKLIDKMKSVDYKIREIEVETKQPMFVGKYTQHITVYCVGVLRCHLPSLLLMPQDCLRLFQGMVQMVRELRVAAECSSAQRCILFFLLVLYQASGDMKASRTWAEFERVTSKIQELLCGTVIPAISTGTWNRTFMVEYFHSFNIYKFRFDAIFSRSMMENRTSFVNNAILCLCSLNTFERVNEVALMCSEFTAYCSHLASDWLGVLKALCCSSVQCGYSELLALLDVSALTTQQLDNIAVFCSVLIARHCFSLNDFLQVALISLTRPVTKGEQGARLTLQILLRIFKADTQLNKGLLHRCAYIKNSCDIHLLAAANRSIEINPLLAVLKAIFKLANTGRSAGRARDSEFAASLLDDITDEEDEDHNKTTKLSIEQHAKQVLTDICHEDWVKEKFLLIDKEQLKDRCLDSHEVWRLVQLICRRRPTSESEHDDIKDLNKQQAVIARILRGLDQWSIRVAWLELQLMHTWQNPNSMEGELSLLLDNIARATIEVFHSYTGTESESSDCQKGGVWLVAPLIAKLPTDVQGRVLQSAALVLERSNKLWQHTEQGSPPHQRQKDKDRESSMSLLNHQPFLALVLTCLKGHDEQREVILSSLQSQLDKFVQCAIEDSLPTDPHHKQLMYEALQLRLSLVGGMFDTIQRSHSVTGDWAHILNKLICYSIVDVKSNSELFYIVLDMLSALIHSTLVSDSADSVENSKKPYHVLIKKIKKDIGDKQSDSLALARQLLPISKHSVEVIACESHSSILDAKGNKIQGFESISKKSGLQVSNKYKISPWELIEGLKNPTPLCWQWFGAVKSERKMLDLEEQHSLMVHHNHPVVDTTDFLAPPPIPPEEVDAPDVVDIEEKSADPEAKAKATSNLARSLASIVPEPKTRPPANKRRTTSRSNSQTAKSGFAGIATPTYESRLNPTAQGSWNPSRNVVAGYQHPYGMNPGAAPAMGRMHSARSSNVKETLENQIRNRQTQAGMPYSNPNPGQSMPVSYGMDVPQGSASTKEQLHMFVNRRKMGGSMTDQFEPPPPQYPTGTQFSTRLGNQGYNMPQPPGYGTPTSAPQGGMMIGGGQQPHSNMMQYNPGQQTMSRYTPAGQPPPAQQQPGGAYGSQYGQPYQVEIAQEGRLMQGNGGQYMAPRASLPQPPNQYNTGMNNQYNF